MVNSDSFNTPSACCGVVYFLMTKTPETSMQGYVNSTLTAFIMVAAVIILFDSIRRWCFSGKKTERAERTGGDF